MEKNGKKNTAVVIAAVLIVVMLLGMMGCQSGGGEPDPTETTGATAATTEATGEPTSEPTEGSEPTTEPAETSEATGEPTEEPTEETTEATQPVTEPGHEHSYTKTTVNPTCTNGGYTLNTCDCGDSYKSGETKATGHDYKKTVVSPTTQAQGYTLYTCQTCGDSYKADYTHKLPAGAQPTEHTCDYDKTTVKPTCTAKGYTTYTCKRCSDSYKADYTDAKGHNYTSRVTKEATCKENGIRTYTCSNCGNSYTETISNKGIAHTWGDWYTTREPSETATGTAERKCSGCGKTETKILDMIPESHKHSYTGKVTKAATCTTDGVMAYICECGDVERTEVIPATGHAYSVTAEMVGTCCEAGSKTYTCSNCGDAYSESTGTTEHSWVHHHTDEVGHEEWYVYCHCGKWSCKASEFSVSAFEAHIIAVDGWGECSYYDYPQWVVDTPASDYYECSVCGATK